MKKIIIAAVITALFAAFQITAMAAVANPASSDVASSHVASSNVASSHVASSHVASSHVASSNAVSGDLRNEIAPYGNEAVARDNEVNPHTGVESMVIPGTVALIAAATAAITLAGKKK